MYVQFNVMRTVSHTLLLLTALLFSLSCGSSRLPKERFSQFQLSKNSFRTVPTKDTLIYELHNVLETPLRLYVAELLHKEVAAEHFYSVNTASDTTIYHRLGEYNKLYLKLLLGDPKQHIIKNKLSLPFPKGKSYNIVQGYNGGFSHQTRRSRYALDFNLAAGDTITSADNGYVVGLIKEYKRHGATPKWTDYGNFITIYHPHSGLYTQYVHLRHLGNLVEIGDQVLRGQPIGICGMTGYMSGEHLHFNVLIPVDDADGLISTTIEFEEGYNGEDLVNGAVVSR